MITVDLHSHTKYSHATASIDEMYQSARSKGLAIFGFSEHSPRPNGYRYLNDYQERLKANFANYHNEVRSLKAINSSQMQVLLGLEMDYIRNEEAYVRNLCLAENYDYIIGGLHFLDTWGFDASASDWQNLSEKQSAAYYVQYYEDLYAMTQTGLFNIVAHPDLIKIFSINSFKHWLQKSSSVKLIKKTLEGVKDANMALEVSSAGLRKPCNEIYPCAEIMQIAADLELNISFGSDSHCVNSVMHGFDQLAEYAQKFGFSESVYFQDRVMLKQSFI